MSKKLIFILLAVVLVVSTLFYLLKPSKKSSLYINVADVDISNVTIKHFDEALFTSDTTNFTEVLAGLKQNYEPFFQSNTASKFWYDQRTDPSQKALFADWRSQVPDYGLLDEALKNAFRHFFYYYPSKSPVEVYTYISKLDYEYPIIKADGYTFIATDLYLGKNHKAYNQFAEYMRYYRDHHFIVYDVMEQFAYTVAAKNKEDNTLLNDMLWWGKVMYFEKAMQPEVADSIIFKYSSQKLKFSQKNEANIWSYFVDNKLIFDTTLDAKRRFIDPAPFSKFGMPSDTETPGMLGRFIGYNIVYSYMTNNPSISLNNLMADTDYRTIFKNSKYKP